MKGKADTCVWKRNQIPPSGISRELERDPFADMHASSIILDEPRTASELRESLNKRKDKNNHDPQRDIHGTYDDLFPQHLLQEGKHSLRTQYSGK